MMPRHRRIRPWALSGLTLLLLLAGFAPGGVSALAGPHTPHISASSLTAGASAPAAATGSGTLSGSLGTPPSTVDVSAEGTADWIEWGDAAATNSNRKANVSPQISAFTSIGSGADSQSGGGGSVVTWSDGTPVISGTNNGQGVFVPGAGNGFRLTLPADPISRTLRLYVNVFAAQMAITAAVSDGSAPAYTDNALVDTSDSFQNGAKAGVYTLTYSAATAGQTLAVTLTTGTDYGVVRSSNQDGGVVIEAATLQQASASPTVTASAAVSATATDTATAGTATDTATAGVTATAATGVTATATTTATVTTATATATGVSATVTTTATATTGVTATVQGSLGAAPSSSVNLTSEGTADWIEWGDAAAANSNRKANVSPQISAFTSIGSGADSQSGGGGAVVTWSDGTPVISGTNNGQGVFVPGAGNGFRFTAAADTTTRALRLYVNVYRATGRFTASLSDGSAPTYTDESLSNQGGMAGGVYTLYYRAASPGQTLTVTWTATAEYGGGGGGIVLEAATLQQNATIPTPAPAPAVSQDHYSLLIDGKRVFIRSTEFHYWRLPSPDLWLDVLQKIKAGGYNGVSIYFDWGFHSPKPGVYDFTGVRDVEKLLRMTEQAGLYVIARPGPYINAETDSGGFPGWLQTVKGQARTSAPDYTAAYMDWLGHIDPILARHQITTTDAANGLRGSVIFVQVENEYTFGPHDVIYMQNIEQKERADGIKVPFSFNDVYLAGTWASGPGSVDLYGFDAYPQGFDCSNPAHWNGVLTGIEPSFRGLAPYNDPIFIPEYQGGSFDFWGGPGYANCYQLTGPDFVNVFYKNVIAQGLTLFNSYMTYGGTSWGWLPSDGLYTSYDYGAAINEQRQLTPKYSAFKRLNYLLDAVAPLRQTNVLSYTIGTNPTVDYSSRYNPVTGTQFYVLRHADSTSTSDISTTIAITTPDGAYPVVPQQPSTAIRLNLNGRDSKLLIAGYDLGAQRLVYSTSELMTHAAIGGRDVAVFYGRPGEDGETVLRYTSQPTVTVLAGNVTSAYDAARGDLRLNYVHSGLARVLIHGGGVSRDLLLLIGTDDEAARFWLNQTEAGPVLTYGPELVRTASEAPMSTTLDLTGDTTATAPLEVFAPVTATAVTWNGAPLATTTTSSGSLAGSLGGPLPVTLPPLTDWRYHAGNPEAQPGFDDSTWTVANHITTTNPMPPLSLPVLYMDDYGYHYGDVWYRGRFTGQSDETGFTLNGYGGSQGVYAVWFNGVYLGSVANGSQTFAFPSGSFKVGAGNVISVLLENMGHSEDFSADDGYKSPRGLEQAVLDKGALCPAGTSSSNTSAAIDWRIQGDLGGENIPDPARGPYNNGGLYGERAGWYLPGYNDASWTSATLPQAVTPGVSWYRTHFTLNLPTGTDAPVGLRFSDGFNLPYRAIIFVNGWNMGRYIDNVGPQRVFSLPAGVLNPNGDNVLALAVWNTGSADVQLNAPSLQTYGVYAGGVPVAVNPVSPTTVLTTSAPAAQFSAAAIAPAAPNAGGILCGGLSAPPSPPTSVDLSAEGTADWSEWGATSVTDFNHKANVPEQIGTFTPVGSGADSWSGGGGVVAVWSDGTPVISGTNNQRGVFVPDAGNGFRLTVPADPITRTLRLYANVYKAQAAVTATLSDGSAPLYTNNSLSSTGGIGRGVYTLAYRAATVGQTLTITLTTLNDYGTVGSSTQNGGVVLEAATLQQNTAATATATPSGTAIATATTAAGTATATPPTATGTATSTAVPPTMTNTPLPSTATNTAVPPTATSTAVPPTTTSTSTPVPATATSTSTAIPPAATATSTAVPPTATSTPTPLPVCQLFVLPAFDTVPRGGAQALLVDAASGSAITLTVRAKYPAQATLYTDSSLGSSGGFGVILTGAHASGGGYRYAFRVAASGLALLTFAIPRAARTGTVTIQVAAQEPCGLFKTVTSFQVRGRVRGMGAARVTAGAVTLAIPLPRGDTPPANAAQLARRGVLRVTTQGHGATARRVLLLTYHPHTRPASVKAGAAHTLFGVAVGT